VIELNENPTILSVAVPVLSIYPANPTDESHIISGNELIWFVRVKACFGNFIVIPFYLGTRGMNWRPHKIPAVSAVFNCKKYGYLKGRVG